MLSREIGLLILLVLAIGVPFLNKPFHIDDTFFLHITRSILNTPFNPFAGEINWFGNNRPVWEVTTNPPFLSYYLTPFAVLSNYSEVALHTAMMLFLLMMAGGIYYLAKRFAPCTWFPVMFVMTSAAVIVSSNAMQDILKGLLLLEGKKYYGVIPIRTMNLNGAGFLCHYQCEGHPIIPYRLFQDVSLETFQVFRVGELTTPI